MYLDTASVFMFVCHVAAMMSSGGRQSPPLIFFFFFFYVNLPKIYSLLRLFPGHLAAKKMYEMTDEMI